MYTTELKEVAVGVELEVYKGVKITKTKQPKWDLGVHP